MSQERHRIPARDQTRVYVTEQGQIAIAQEGVLESEPRTVYLEPGDIPAIVHWLQECAFDALEQRHDGPIHDAISDEKVYQFQKGNELAMTRAHWGMGPTTS